MPQDASAFVEYCAREGIEVISIHASYLINLAGTREPFASQSRDGLIVEVQRAPAYGATLVNTHIGSHRGVGREAGLRRIVESVRAVLAESPPSVRLLLENSSGGGDLLGSRLEELAAILDGVVRRRERIGWGSASTRRTCGAPATTSLRWRASRPCWIASTSSSGSSACRWCT